MTNIKSPMIHTDSPIFKSVASVSSMEFSPRIVEDSELDSEVENLSPLNENELSDEEEEDDSYEASHDGDDFNFSKMDRKLSINDAQSFIGGSFVRPSRKPSTAEEILVIKPPSPPSLTDTSTRKIFSFSLPFGNFSSLTSSITKQLSSFKLDSPSVTSFPHDENEQHLNKHEIELKLQRQESISTIEEEYIFRDFKGLDSSRLRAVKNAILPNLEYLSSKEKPSYEKIYSKIRGNIVFIGGYRGSVLRDAKTNKRIWIPLKAGLNLQKIELLLGPTDEDELNAKDLVIPDGILKNIGPVDVCKKIMKKMSNGKTNIKTFGYDWRLNCDLNSYEFEKFLEDIKTKTGEPTLVIAHSMGGLVAHAALQRSPHLFRSMIYCGVPSECPNILGPMRFGDSVGLSSKILRAEANFFFRSSFVFLPLDGKVFIDKKTGQRYDLDYFDPETWVKHNLSPLVSEKRRREEQKLKESKRSKTKRTQSASELTELVSKKPQKLDFASRITDSSLKQNLLEMKRTLTSSDSDQPEYQTSFSDCYTYLEKVLATNKKFLLDLEYNPKIEYPPLCIVYGNTVPSLRGARVKSEDSIADDLYDDFFYGHGDGVVHQKWLMPETRGFPTVGKFVSRFGHVTLMTDLKAMGKALVAVTVAEKERKKLANAGRTSPESSSTD